MSEQTKQIEKYRQELGEVRFALAEARNDLKKAKQEIERLHEIINGFEEQSAKELQEFLALSEKYEQAKQEVAREIVQILKDYAKSDDCLIYDMSDKEQNELCEIHNLGVNEVKQSISIIAMDIENKYIGE